MSHINSTFSVNQFISLFHHLKFVKNRIVFSSYRYFITFAGTPPTIEYGGTSLVTTALAKTTAPSPIVTPPTIKAPSPIQQSFPIITENIFS
jgi:hypothetical protein